MARQIGVTNTVQVRNVSVYFVCTPAVVSLNKATKITCLIRHCILGIVIAFSDYPKQSV